MPISPEHALSPKSGHGSAVRITWGLVQIPIRLHLVTDGTTTVPARSTFTVDGNPIGNRKYDKVTGENYEGDVIKKVAHGDRWVELTDDEIEAHSTLTKGYAEITTFVPLSALGSTYVAEKFAAWTPDRMTVGKTKVVDPGAAKACALLRKAMAAQDVAALVLVPTTSGGKYVALLPDGQAAYLSYANGVRAIVDTVADIEVSDGEMALATQLIDGIGIDNPVLVDEAGNLLREFVAAKAEGVAPVVTAAPVTAAPVDLMAALTASLAATAPKAPAAVKKAAAPKVAKQSKKAS